MYPAMKKIIVVYLLVTLVCLGMLQWLIQQPAQNQFLARQLTTSQGLIRDLEADPSGTEFRWLNDSVTVMVPKPTQIGFLRMQMWTAPQRVATAIHVGNHRFALPVLPALQQRKVALLVTSTTTQSTLLPVKIDLRANPGATAIAWAFADAYWINPKTNLQPQPAIPLFVIITLFVVIFSCYRVSMNPLTSIAVVGIVVGIVVGMQTSISAFVASITDQPTLYNNLWVLGVAWGIWYWKYPSLQRFIARASKQARVVLVAYGTLTLIPVIGMIAPPESASIKIEELRQLQACPTQWSGVAWDITHNFNLLSQCVTDNIGWRNAFIRVKNEVDYQVFGTSSRVYFGNSGFYFMRRWSDDRFLQLQEILQTPSKHQKLLSTIKQYNQNYAQQGVHVIVVIAPSKEFIYPENLPWNAPKFDYQMVRDFEKDLEASGIDVIRAYDLLQQHKQDVPLLYHPRDFHWNDLAAYYVAQAVTNRIAQHQNVKSPWKHPLDACSVLRKASDQTFAALLSNRSQYAGTYCQKTSAPDGTPWITEKWIVENRFNRDYYVWQSEAVSPTRVLGAVEIDGDSYSSYFQNSGLERYFNHIAITEFSDWHDAFSPAHLTYLQRNNIRYVVWQLRDASLPLLFNDIYDEY